jgi:hypothetical protein
MSSTGLTIRDVSPRITTFSVPFNRFAPFGYRKFVAVGNRATAIRLHDDRILLLNPVPLDQAVRDKLDQLGGVHLVASDLGHHMYVKEYVEAWPKAKTIGVPGLDSKRKDIKWDYIYKDWRSSPEDEFDFAQDIETVLFEGFITYCVAWYHKPTQTLIQSDLMMNLPCTEVCFCLRIRILPGPFCNIAKLILYQQYHPSSSDQGPFSREFAKRAHPQSVWMRRLIYYIATVDYVVMRRDTKKVAQWQIARIIPCHGDVLEGDGNAAWASVYTWFLHGPPQASVASKLMVPVMKLARRVFLM